MGKGQIIQETMLEKLTNRWGEKLDPSLTVYHKNKFQTEYLYV